MEALFETVYALGKATIYQDLTFEKHHRLQNYIPKTFVTPGTQGLMLPFQNDVHMLTTNY